MITTLAFMGVLFVVASIISVFASTGSALPFGMDGFVHTSANQIAAFVNVFWPLKPVLVCVILYVTIQIGVLGLRFLFGSRVPQPQDV